jgi:hypothetical protein
MASETDNIYSLEKLLKDTGEEQGVIDGIRRALGIEEELEYVE